MKRLWSNRLAVKFFLSFFAVTALLSLSFHFYAGAVLQNFYVSSLSARMDREALLIAADAFKRAGSADPKALADAIRATDIKDIVSPGPGIRFDAKGQNSALKNSAIQNRGGKLVTVAPKAAANAKPELPMRPYDKR